MLNLVGPSTSSRCTAHDAADLNLREKLIQCWEVAHRNKIRAIKLFI